MHRARALLPSLRAHAAAALAVACAFALPWGAAAAESDAIERARGGLKNTAGPAGIATSGSIYDIVGTLVFAVLSLTGIVFVGLMIYAGILWMIAAGDTTKVDKAKKVIESAVIGIILTGLAFAITNFILDRIVGAQTGLG